MKFLKSKWFILSGGLVAAMLAFFWGREVWQQRQIDREIAAMRAEIAAAEGRRAELSAALAYLRSSEYGERQARALLGLKKPGEFVVALPQTEESIAGQQGQRGEQNWKKWWKYFFGK